MDNQLIITTLDNFLEANSIGTLMNGSSFNQFMGFTPLVNQSIENHDESCLEVLYLGFKPFDRIKDAEGDPNPEYWDMIQISFGYIQEKIRQYIRENADSNYILTAEEDGTYQTRFSLRDGDKFIYWVTITLTDESIIITQIHYPQ